MWKPIYASLDMFKDFKRLRNVSDTDDDAIMRLKLSAASRAVDTSCSGAVKRQFGKVATAVTRTYDLRWSRTWCAYWAEIDDLMDTTGLTFTVDGTELTSAQYKLRPRNAIADGMPYTYVILGGAVSVSDGELSGLALWGWNAPWPDVVTEATMLQASRLNIRRDSPYGLAGGTDSGTEARLLERLDPDIAPMLTDYVRTGWVAR